MSPRPGLDTLDLVVRTSTTVLTATGSIVGDGDVVLTGQLSGIETDAPTSPVRLVLDSSDAARLDAQEVEPGTVTLFSAQEELPYRIVRYSTASAIGERYEIHSGSLEDLEGNIQFDFVAVSEPIHIPIIGAVLMIAVCPVLAGVSFLSEWVQARTSGWRAACVEEGGFPFVVPVFRFKVRLWARRDRLRSEGSGRVQRPERQTSEQQRDRVRTAGGMIGVQSPSARGHGGPECPSPQRAPPAFILHFNQHVAPEHFLNPP